MSVTSGSGTAAGGPCGQAGAEPTAVALAVAAAAARQAMVTEGNA